MKKTTKCPSQYIGQTHGAIRNAFKHGIFITDTGGRLGDIDLSGIYTKLIQAAGRFAENYASDLLYSIKRIEILTNRIYHIPEHETIDEIYAFGIRKNGVDSNDIIINRFRNNLEHTHCIYPEPVYRKILAVRVLACSREKVNCTLHDITASLYKTANTDLKEQKTKEKNQTTYDDEFLNKQLKQTTGVLFADIFKKIKNNMPFIQGHAPVTLSGEESIQAASFSNGAYSFAWYESSNPETGHTAANIACRSAYSYYKILSIKAAPTEEDGYLPESSASFVKIQMPDDFFVNLLRLDDEKPLHFRRLVLAQTLLAIHQILLKRHGLGILTKAEAEILHDISKKVEQENP